MQASASSKITPEILQQYPFLAAYLVLVMGVVIFAAMGSFASWGLVFYRRSQSMSILPLIRPWEPRRWAFIDLVVLGATVVALQVLFAGLANRWIKFEESDQLPLELAAAGGVASIVAVVFGTLWICLRYGTSPSHLGFDSIRTRTIYVGLIGGLLGLPLLYILMGFVSSLSQTKYDHPLINSASESGNLTTYLCGFFAAAIAAPIVEEFFFRVILQGWLQSIPFKSIAANFIGAEKPVSLNVDNVELAGHITNPDNPVETPTETAELSKIYSSSTLSNEHSTPVNSVAIPPIWPSIITGLLFGLAHIEYGVSFIPLSVLGIYLGLIYRQTHSIWPCIIIHMMLNSFSMMMLGLLILMKQAGISVD